MVSTLCHSNLSDIGDLTGISCRTQVVNPRMHAHLYTWGAGHATAEGERIPVKVRCFCPMQLCSCGRCLLFLTNIGDMLQWGSA